VAISGFNTHFVNGVSTATFGSGIVVNSLTVTSSTLAVANITIADNAAIGFRNVTVTTGTEIAFENEVGPFIVTAPPPPIPRVTLVDPAKGARGQTLNITISGQNTHFATGTSAVSFSGTGIVVNSVSVASPTSALANITIAPDTSLGFRDVLVTTGGEIAVGLLAFQIEESQSPANSIEALIAIVQGLDLPPGRKNALLSQLRAAAATGPPQSTCGNLKSFLNLVSAQRGKEIPTSQADQLTAATEQIRTALACK
jgi:hypothetical protein